MFTSYRRILAQPGALRFSLTGLVARLPISMVGLGIVLLVSAATGSYGVAGAISAAYMFANAGFAILQGRLLDRLGQGRVLAAASIGFGVATSLLVVVGAGRLADRCDLRLRRASAARSSPRSARRVRARWSHVLDRPADVQTAFALEAVLDEAVFILGPILVDRARDRLAPGRRASPSRSSPASAAPSRSAAQRAHRAAAPPASTHVGAAAADAVAHGRPARRRLRRARRPLRRGRGHHGRVRRGARPQGGVRRAARAVGARQPAAPASSPARSTGGAGRRFRVRWGALAMACAMVPLSFIDSLPLMGVVALRRRLRDRADDDRHDVADRGRRAVRAG